jgi:hypothetical protein
MVNRTVARLYDSYQSAAEAVRDLEASGIPGDAISLIASNADERVTHSEGNEAGPGAEVGAGVGAFAGGGAGVLAGLGMLAIPGVGPVVAAGWLVALAAGAVGGAVAGGLIGGLIGSGVSRDTAEVYAEGVRRGGTLVSARVPEEDAAAVEAVLDRHNPVDPASRRAEYAKAGWKRYDQDRAYDLDEADKDGRVVR